MSYTAVEQSFAPHSVVDRKICDSFLEKSTDFFFCKLGRRGTAEFLQFSMFCLLGPSLLSRLFVCYCPTVATQAFVIITGAEL